MISPLPLPALPALDALPELNRALADSGVAVLSAPPGSGKTTALPLALMGADWLQGQRIVVLEPRRVAARAAARRMAALLGEALGERVGYQVRGERRVGRNTRIEVITEGLLTRRLQADPELPGVGLLIFDEFHERSLDVDLALALSLDVRENLRPDLKVLVMSATLDAAPISRLLGGAPQVTAGGRLHAVEVHFGPDVAAADCGAAVAQVARQALAQGEGDVLAFLPGQREIRQAEAAWREPTVAVYPLYGQLPAAQQDAALRPDPQGRRKLILATNIAQTSLTVEGVRAVVDAGWERRAVFDMGAAANRLDTVRISQASAEQRAGRAGREAPGQAWRLWREDTHARLALHDAPEIGRADLTRLALELAAWGAAPEDLAFLDAPPEALWRYAQQTLQGLGAVDSTGRLQPAGRALLDWPMAPRLAQMIRAAEARGLGQTAVWLALLLEQGGPAGELDLEQRLGRLWSGRESAGARVPEAEIRRLLKRLKSPGERDARAVGAIIASGFPERIARARRERPGAFRCADGGEAQLPADHPLARQDWLAIAHWQPGERRRVLAAAPLTREDIQPAHLPAVVLARRARWDARAGALVAEEGWFVGSLPVDVRAVPVSDEEAVPALLAELRRRGLDCLGWSDEVRQLQARIASLRCWHPDAGWPAVDDAALAEALDEWLAPFMAGARRLEHLSRLDLAAALRAFVPPTLLPRLDDWAPERWQVPTGSRIKLRYQMDGAPPVLSVRLQEMFGEPQTPAVDGGRVPVTLELLSPAQRPIQVTRDLAGFWSGSYAEVRKEMRGRYPKHVWPEDPVSAEPTRRAKPRKS